MDGTQANVELGRRVRSWKAAYKREVSTREALEKEMLCVNQVLYKDQTLLGDSQYDSGIQYNWGWKV